MKILHIGAGLIITYLKNFIFDDDCIACQKHGKHGDKKILIDSVLCLSINGLWIAFHWRRTWLPPQHSFFAHVKIGMCESNVYSSINQYYLIEYIYNKYTIYAYIFILSICIFLSKKFLLIDVVVGILIKLFLCENLCH